MSYYTLTVLLSVFSMVDFLPLKFPGDSKQSFDMDFFGTGSLEHTFTYVPCVLTANFHFLQRFLLSVSSIAGLVSIVMVYHPLFEVGKC